MQDHMKRFKYKGKQYVKNMETGKVMEVADIQMPSFNEMDSMRAYPPDGVRPKDFKPKEKEQDVSSRKPGLIRRSLMPNPRQRAKLYVM